MDQSEVEKVLLEAARAVESLPEPLKARGFELAVNMLTGDASSRSVAQRPSGVVRPMPPDSPRMTVEGETEISDLLPVCKRNPDRYLVFMRDIEASGDACSSSALVERFRKYKQDVPKLPSRDLADMIARGLVEQIGRGRDATFLLKRKGRERLAQLDAAVTA